MFLLFYDCFGVVRLCVDVLLFAGLAGQEVATRTEDLQGTAVARAVHEARSTVRVNFRDCAEERGLAGFNVFFVGNRY